MISGASQARKDLQEEFPCLFTANPVRRQIAQRRQNPTIGCGKSEQADAVGQACPEK
jgi:hypothetical protein